MAKFYGVIGYITTEETKPGVWEEKITERKYAGELLQKDVRIGFKVKALHQRLRVRQRLPIGSRRVSQILPKGKIGKGAVLREYDKTVPLKFSVPKGEGTALPQGSVQPKA